MKNVTNLHVVDGMETKRRRRRSDAETNPICPKSEGQAILLENIKKHDMTFAIGVAGTGKTYIAIAQAIVDLKEGRVDKIMISRPAVEAGERLGFLPGNAKEKVDPYMRPIFDVMHERVNAEEIKKWMEKDIIEVAPLAFIRGRTFKNCAMILDEAQNATFEQLKMFLTRIGEGSYAVISGDPEQNDLPAGQSGLQVIVNKITNAQNVSPRDYNRICVSLLDVRDIVRHEVVRQILEII